MRGNTGDCGVVANAYIKARRGRAPARPASYDESLINTGCAGAHPLRDSSFFVDLYTLLLNASYSNVAGLSCGDTHHTSNVTPPFSAGSVLPLTAANCPVFISRSMKAL